jgi:hypothetical protein
LTKLHTRGFFYFSETARQELLLLLLLYELELDDDELLVRAL